MTNFPRYGYLAGVRRKPNAGSPQRADTPRRYSGRMSNDRVQIAVENHVAEVSLVRADKHNALDGEMFGGDRPQQPKRLASEPGVRAVVIHGEGPSFCSGIDVGWLAGGQAGGFADLAVVRDDFGANLFQRVATAWIGVPVPVIAAIHGNCLGGGLQIALGADIRIAAPDSKLSVREVHWGLVPDMGITATLPRLVALDVAKEPTFTGRVISADEADRAGLVTRVDLDPLSARDLAREIAGRSPDAVRAAKKLYESVQRQEALGWNSRPNSATTARLNQPDGRGNGGCEQGAGGLHRPGRYLSPRRLPFRKRRIRLAWQPHDLRDRLPRAGQYDQTNESGRRLRDPLDRSAAQAVDRLQPRGPDLHGRLRTAGRLGLQRRKHRIGRWRH